MVATPPPYPLKTLPTTPPYNSLKTIPTPPPYSSKVAICDINEQYKYIAEHNHQNDVLATNLPKYLAKQQRVKIWQGDY